MYQQYSLPVAPFSPHSHTKMSHTDLRAASHKTSPPFSPDRGTSNAVDNTKLSNYTASFKIYVIIKLTVSQINGMTRYKLLPQSHEYLTPLWSIHLFLTCRLLWKCESKQWHFILEHIQSSSYSLQLLCVVLNKDLSVSRECGNFGLCKMAEESVTLRSFSVLL